MKSTQEVYEKLVELKRDLKMNKELVKEELEGSEKYKNILEEIKAIKEKKVRIETLIKKELPVVMVEIDNLNLEIKNTQEMLADVAIIELMNKEVVAVEDNDGTKFPVWSVKFKKI